MMGPRYSPSRWVGYDYKGSTSHARWSYVGPEEPRGRLHLSADDCTRLGLVHRPARVASTDLGVPPLPDVHACHIRPEDGSGWKLVEVVYSYDSAELAGVVVAWPGESKFLHRSEGGATALHDWADGPYNPNKLPSEQEIDEYVGSGGGWHISWSYDARRPPVEPGALSGMSTGYEHKWVPPGRDEPVWAAGLVPTFRPGEVR